MKFITGHDDPGYELRLPRGAEELSLFFSNSARDFSSSRDFHDLGPVYNSPVPSVAQNFAGP
jgi:hypothetical protein